MNWKTLAWILIVILVLENALLFWGYQSLRDDEKKTYQCYYEVCKEFSDANYDTYSGLCTCYDYDIMGNPKVAETKLLT